MTASTFARQLTEIVGESYLIENTADYPAYQIQGAVPALVVAPGSAEELAQVVAAAHSARVAVVSRGGGTRQSWGRPLTAPFIVVQTTRLKRVLIYEPDDLTISVEAGMHLADLEAILAPNNQMLPLDVPLPQRSTIGGILASGADGPRRLGYGTARDLLIGIRVVEAGGRISKAGGMVVKNVSGFDMMKLYLGSMGTLAIIVSANFKLMPRPRAAGAISCMFKSPNQAFALADAIHSSQLTPVAVEYHEGYSSSGGEPVVSLELRAEGLPAAVERHLRDVEAMAEKAGAVNIFAIQEGNPDLTQLWAAHNDLPQTIEVEPDELVLRLSCLPADLARALEQVRGAAAKQNLELRVVARALSGIAYLRLRGANDALRSTHRVLLAGWPQLVVLAKPRTLLAELPIWGAPPTNLELMRRIKREFDPEGLLNPGRYVV